MGVDTATLLSQTLDMFSWVCCKDYDICLFFPNVSNCVLKILCYRYLALSLDFSF